MLIVLAIVAAGLYASQPATGDVTWSRGTERVADSFERVQSPGWGDANLGGPYTPSDPAYFSVDGHAGVASPPRSGSSVSSTLGSIGITDVVAATTLALPTLPAEGMGVYAGIQVRSTAGTYYQANLRVLPDGAGTISIHRVNGSTSKQTTLVQDAAAIEGLAAGQSVELEVAARGTDTVELAARAWITGTDRPDWKTAVTDTDDARISAGGAVGLWTYVSTTTQPVPVVFQAFSAAELKKQDDGKTPVAVPDQAPAAAGFERVVAGAAPIGTTTYEVPVGAIFVSPSGSDSGTGAEGAPFRTIAKAISKSPSGATIVARAGSYHESLIIPPQKKLTIQPYPNEAVWLEGSKVVDNWVKSGDRWVSDGWKVRFDDSPTYSRGKSDGHNSGWKFVNPDYPMAAHPDQVWVDNTALAQVGSLAKVDAKSFYLDEGASKIYTGADPTGKTVRAAALVKAIVIASPNSTVRGIGIRRYSPSVPDMGAVVVAAKGVTLEHDTITDMATTGLSTFATGTTVRNVTLARNGMLGAHASYADGLVVASLLSEDNNTEHFNRSPVAGGLKVHKSRGVSVQDSVFRRNLGNALWFDESVYGMTLTGNDLLDNTGRGIVIELSATARIADNLVAGNTLTGILVSDSGQVEIWNNTITDNERNINIVQGDRRASDLSVPGHDDRQKLPDPTVTWITGNVSVHNNVLAEGTGNCLLCVEDYSHQRSAAQMNIQSDGNVFQRPSASAPKWAVVWSRGTGNPQVFTSIKDFASGTGRDRQSYAVDGAAVLKDRKTLTAAVADLEATVALPIPAAIAEQTGIPAGTRQLGASD